MYNGTRYRIVSDVQSITAVGPLAFTSNDFLYQIHATEDFTATIHNHFFGSSTLRVLATVKDSPYINQTLREIGSEPHPLSDFLNLRRYESIVVNSRDCNNPNTYWFVTSRLEPIN